MGNRLALSAQEVLMVRGPARVEALTEGVEVLGVSLRIGQTVVVRQGKELPFEAPIGGEVALQLGDRGGYSLTRGRLGTHIWQHLTGRVLEGEGYRRVVVVGATDAGKSTLTAYLANRAHAWGLRVGVVDGDVGQSDLAPPGCVGAALVDRPIYDLRDLRAGFYGFVGDKTPYHVRDEVIEQIRCGERWVREAGGVDLTLINTDGYIQAGGLDYKADLIRCLAPELTICLEDEGAGLRAGLEARLGNIQVVSAPSPGGVAKTIQDRGERRLAQYRRFLTRPVRVRADLQALQIHFLGTLYHAGGHMEGRGVLVKEGLGGGKLALAYGREPAIIRLEERVEVGMAALRGMFVALELDNRVLGFGRVYRVYGGFQLGLEVGGDAGRAFDTLHFSLIALAPGIRGERSIPYITYRREGRETGF